jgi:hypothetical protein
MLTGTLDRFRPFGECYRHEGGKRSLGVIVALLGLLFTIFTTATSVQAASIDATPDSYLSLVRTLKPGDTLHLAPGVYRHGLPLHDLRGNPNEPIVIVGDDSGGGAILVARAGANTVSIKDAAYVAVRSLVLDGAGLAVDAVKAEGTSRFAHHITLENLVIINHGVDQQIVGISSKCPAWNWVIRGNVIRGAGTGIYLGNSDGSAPFVGGLIEDNLIADTIGYNLQIKHQNARSAIMPTERATTVIRDNVFSKATAGSIGALARPNVLLGHLPLSGPGSADSYSVYGNFFYENPNELLLQAEGNVVIHNNVFLNTVGSAVGIRPQHAPLRSIVIAQNTIVARGTGISVLAATAETRQVVVANAVFAGLPLFGGQWQWNVTGSFQAAAEALVGPFEAPGEMDFSPRGGQLNAPAAIADTANASAEDFFGRVRTSSAGAIAPGLGTPWRFGLVMQTKKVRRLRD